MGTPRKPMAQTIDLALQRLEDLDILEGPEMRHQSSLSPIALLRKWRFSHAVKKRWSELYPFQRSDRLWPGAEFGSGQGLVPDGGYRTLQCICQCG